MNTHKCVTNGYKMFTVTAAVLSLLCLIMPLQSLAAIAQTPLFLTVNKANPLVMLTMSNDHQLYYKAYDDYSDIDEDGTPDTTYDNDIDYYGYFDSYKCYEYDSTNKLFEPRYTTANKYCAASPGEWSGNFLNWASMARIDTIRKILYGGYRSTDTSSLTVLERTFLPNDAHSWAKYYAGTDINQLTPFSASDLTICNTTEAGSSGLSQDKTDPPLMRIASGDYALWAANERWQCRWSEEKSASNGNTAASGLSSASSNPSTGDGLGEVDYVVRVEACNSSLLGEENCKRYPDGNYKPIGLLQEHADDGVMNFGLMTGSYTKNKDGGVLRKNIGVLTDEVNVDSDGTFKSPLPTDSIINTLNKFRIYGYRFDEGTYRPATDSDDCTWGLSTFNNGSCTNWGNPQSEIFLETLRYFAGKSESTTFKVATTNDKITGLTTATWSDPLSADNYCAPLNIINFNASTTSYDGDELSGASDIGIASLSDEVNKIGDEEGITGDDYFIGENGSDNNQLCTGKTVSALSDVQGTCPDAPRLEGTYNIAGLAHYARTTDIRSGLTGAQNVYTYGVALAPSVPSLVIPTPDKTKTVVILPACRNKALSPNANCAIVDFKIVSQDINGGTGKVYVNWEDSEQGGDYDQDMWGVLSYTITNTQITVTTDSIAESTPNDMAFGYVISGTNAQDGFHAHSGINNFNYTDATGATGCTGCTSGDAATSYTYTLGSSSTGLLQQPLYYASKWGGFKEDPESATANNTLDSTSEWDSNSDGKPDSYFYASNPGKLGDALSQAFDEVASTKSSAASIVADSVTLETGTHIYQAQFDSADWTGTIKAFPLDLAGDIGTESWDAQTILNSKSPSSRVILTNKPGTGGVEFAWANLTTAQQDYLSTDPTTATNDGEGQQRLGYIRGESTYELKNGHATITYRNRDHKLGDIVSSTPYHVGAPLFNYPDDYINEADATTFYSGFEADIHDITYTYTDADGVTTITENGREPVLYTGANDGMLHAFSAADGDELFAYVPNSVYANLSELTDINYVHQYFVDGSPTAGDIYAALNGCSTMSVQSTPSTTCWRTVLVGGLNAGGKGLYALDVTDPADVTVANAGDVVLWDIDSTTTGYSELGYTFSQPAIVRLATNDWGVIVGNGYGGANGHAILYVIDITDGSLIKTITVDDTGSNGLSTVAPVDIDYDGIVDYVYAGDLKGNLWKFDLTATNASSWASAFKSGSTPEPLFTAVYGTAPSTTVQPITSPLEVSGHPTGTGYMIYFGTGKYFEDSDNTVSASSPIQSFYGIWDKNDGSTHGKARSDLLEQTIDYEVTQTFDDGSTYDLRVTSNNTIAWDDGVVATPASDFGWYMDLHDPAPIANYGERVIHAPILRNGRIIFTTLIPSSHACEYGGTGWLMELDSTDGSRLDISPWDLNQDGYFEESDFVIIGTDAEGNDIKVAASGKKSKVGIIQRPTVISAGNKEYKYASGSKNAAIEKTVESNTYAAKGRSSWRQLK